MTVTRKNTRDGSHVRVMAWIPRELHDKVLRFIYLSHGSMNKCVISGLRRVVSDAKRTWPKEYWFSTLAEKEAFMRFARRYERKFPQASSATL